MCASLLPSSFLLSWIAMKHSMPSSSSRVFFRLTGFQIIPCWTYCILSLYLSDICFSEEGSSFMTWFSAFITFHNVDIFMLRILAIPSMLLIKNRSNFLESNAIPSYWFHHLISRREAFSARSFYFFFLSEVTTSWIMKILISWSTSSLLRSLTFRMTSTLGFQHHEESRGSYWPTQNLEYPCSELLCLLKTLDIDSFSLILNISYFWTSKSI